MSDPSLVHFFFADTRTAASSYVLRFTQIKQYIPSKKGQI
uniref:Uncharacterized protein n=1 Tax=Arundo donax TaxID=35708 RepID=A0A0A8YAS3_ARUDO